MSLDTKFRDKVILIVEDNQSLRSKVKNFLHVNGAAVIIEADDFQDAYELIRDEIFDYCICDYKIFNTDAQNFIKILRKEKRLLNDNQLIMAGDFYEELQEFINARAHKQVKGKDKNINLNDAIEGNFKHSPEKVYEVYSFVRSFILHKVTNENIECTILNIDIENLSVTLFINNLEDTENFARQVKFESYINGEMKNHTIIGDLKVIEQRVDGIQELELSVPGQYKSTLDEIEKDLMQAQHKTKTLLEIMKGEY